MQILDVEAVGLEELEYVSKAVGIQFTIKDGNVLCSDEDYKTLERVSRLYRGEFL